jgi:RHS repeat-associated protein
MAGDTIRIAASAFYKSAEITTNKVTSDEIITALIQALSGNTTNDGAHNATGTNSPISTNFSRVDYEKIQEKDPNENQGDKPKAYLNFVTFDNHFNMIDDNSGVRQVNSGPDALQALSVDRIVIRKTGFIYIYTSNQMMFDIYFDNLIVVHNSGPLMEETHYYPFGLTMAGISSKALGKLENLNKFNGKELQTKEFSDDSGLEMYDFRYRFYDAQLGVFHNQDRLADKFSYMSPYQFCSNSPIWMKEIDGLEGVKVTEIDENGEKRTVIEKNVVVLVQPKKEIPENATQQQIDKINKQNEKIEKANNEKIAETKQELNDFYNGDDGKGTKDSEGNKVYFKFNIKGVADFSKKGMSQDEIQKKYVRISIENGTPSVLSIGGKKFDAETPAAVVTRDGTLRGDAHGSTLVNVIRINSNAPTGTASHEVLHTLGLDDNGYNKGGLLNSPPELISHKEVDNVINKSNEKK